MSNIIAVEVRTVDHNYEEVKKEVRKFDSSEQAMKWLEDQYELPGVGGVEFVTSGSLGDSADDDELSFTIHLQQVVFVAVVTTNDTAYGKPGIYVANDIEELMRIVRKQNGVPDTWKDAYLWFERECDGLLHVASHYVE